MGCCIRCSYSGRVVPNADEDEDRSPKTSTSLHTASTATTRASEDETGTLSAGFRCASKVTTTTVTSIEGKFWVDDELSELETEPPPCNPARRNGVSEAPTGAFNVLYADWKAPYYKHTKEQRNFVVNALTEVPLFSHLKGTALRSIADTMEIVTHPPGTLIAQQGMEGSDSYILMSGRIEEYDIESKSPVTAIHAELCSTVPGALPQKLGSMERCVSVGELFGHRAMVFGLPRHKSWYAAEKSSIATLRRDVYLNLISFFDMKKRDVRQAIIRNIRVFETMNEEQVAKLTESLEVEKFEGGEEIITQGTRSTTMYILIQGECSAFVGDGIGRTSDVEAKHYYPGDYFGEICFMHPHLERKASVRAVDEVKVLSLARAKFERLFGSFEQLQHDKYIYDPRKVIADFYQPGAAQGPGGICPAIEDSERQTQWFAVYRPTSRDAIAKMIGGDAVGKGLNIKGKSAKKNHLSGFVPFLQISDNAHKDHVEASPEHSRIEIFFQTAAARESVSKVLRLHHDMDAIVVRSLDSDAYPGVFGINLPESIVRDAYIMRPDLTPPIGWETGRESEPAYMNMNLHALREQTPPKIVLYQFDASNPMNPHGLLLAYAEAFVKPVVSDFDTFTVGSRGMFFEVLPAEQLELIQWLLAKTRQVLEEPCSASWNSRWLNILQTALAEGFHPHMPQYGFGDTTSSKLIEAAIRATKDSGAIRHGAECFNFWFPQQIDDHFLVVWEGFPDKPWTYLSEEELREFLLERIRDGYSFPLNPVWPVRDKGWFEIFRALQDNRSAKETFEAWYPNDSGIPAEIVALHDDFPDGFARGDTNPVEEATEEVKALGLMAKLEQTWTILGQTGVRRRSSLATAVDTVRSLLSFGT